MVQLDFFEPPVATIPRLSSLGEKLENQESTSISVANVQEGVQSKVNIKLAKEKSYKYEKDNIVINNQSYKLTVSHTKGDEGLYELDSTNTYIKTLVFRLKTHTREGKEQVLKFKVGFSEKSVGNNVGYKIQNQQISYIQKLDKNFGGKRFSNSEGNSIQNFEYFRYVFGGTGFHDAIIAAIKDVIVDIHTKSSNN